MSYFTDLNTREDDPPLSGPDWRSRSITDFLISQISRLDHITVTSRSVVREVLQEQEFALLSGLTEETTQLGRFLEADYLLSGDYSLYQGIMTVNARLLNVETAEIVRAFRVVGPETSIHQLQERLFYEFTSFAGIPLRRENLAAPDYDPDTSSIRRFYRAEAMFEEGENADARKELEALLAENPLFTPARQLIQDRAATPSGSSASGLVVDGLASVEAADEELRRQLYFRNLSRSFALYAVAQAYRVEVKDVKIESRDAELFEVQVEGEVVLREDFRPVLEDFLEVNPYLTPESRASYERFIRRGGFSQGMPELFHLQFQEPFLLPEESYHGFVRITLKDASGEVLWRVDSNHVEGSFPIYSPRLGEQNFSRWDPSSWFHISSSSGSAALGRRRSFATLGGSLKAPHFSGIWLGQAHFSISMMIPRQEVSALATVTGEPHFGRIYR
ncbi:FlgO family outer membrane protein [Alkalispirochaeta americana]|uniref:FlgO family outer membrane protein n=1 Tax=Alkalispirochaeta americana TaxID=159291 RepID=UPI00117AE18F|nr:hypothetical protein [Alkalispirochaeta americana]